jgi:hypothetical protein
MRRELPVTKPVEIGSGWYLRGDLGYSVQHARRCHSNYRVFTAGPPATYTGQFDTSTSTATGRDQWA